MPKILVAVWLVIITVLVGEANAAPDSLFTRGVRLLRSSAGDPKWKSLMTSTAGELRQRSPTFAEMLERLATTPNVLLYIQGGRFSEFGLLGRSRFEIAASGTLVGRIEINEIDAVRPHAFEARVRGLAHELAHAYEVICLRLPHHATTTLRDVLATRAATTNDQAHGLETPFARAVETTVIHEWFARRRTESQLKTLAVRHGLSDCSARDAAGLSASSSPAS